MHSCATVESTVDKNDFPNLKLGQVLNVRGQLPQNPHLLKTLTSLTSLKQPTDDMF